MRDIIAEARRYRAKYESMALDLDDEVALEYPRMFPIWDSTLTYAVGDKVRYEEKLYKCLQAHTAQEAWNPADSASLWAEVLAGQEGTDIGEWTQPDSTNPYMIGDRVIFNGHIYESLVDNNLWSPADYPAGWQLIE